MVKRDHELDNTGRISKAQEVKNEARRSTNRVTINPSNADEFDFPELER